MCVCVCVCLSPVGMYSQSYHQLHFTSESIRIFVLRIHQIDQHYQACMRTMEGVMGKGGCGGGGEGVEMGSMNTP